MGAIPSSLSVMIPHFAPGVNVNQVKFTVNGKICKGTKPKCIANNKSDTNGYQKLRPMQSQIPNNTSGYQSIRPYRLVSVRITLVICRTFLFPDTPLLLTVAQLSRLHQMNTIKIRPFVLLAENQKNS